jgi:CRISPR type I-E-associated protein CasB/Cse2
MSTTLIPVKDRAARFVGRLRALKSDRGRLAALRRALSPATAHQAWSVIADLGGDIGHPVYSGIAALYAQHPEDGQADNFGEICRQIGGCEKTGKPPASAEARFRRLLACQDQDDLLHQLRSWIRLAASQGVGVPYQSLFEDAWGWPWYASDIRVRWARSFWSAKAEPEAASQAAQSETDEDAS